MHWRSLIIAGALAAATLCAGAAEQAPAASSPAASSPAASSPPATAIPYRTSETGSADLATRAIVALAICALVGGLAIYFLRGRVGAPLRGVPSRRISITQVQRLTPKHTTVLLRWDDEELLVVVGEGHASLLARKPGAATAATDATP